MCATRAEGAGGAAPRALAPARLRRALAAAGLVPTTPPDASQRTQPPPKVDAAAVDELEARLRGINSLASMTRASRSVVPLDYVLGVGGFDLDKVEDVVSRPGVTR